LELKNEKQPKIIKTKIKDIDSFLNGGFKTGFVYELVGPSLSGKSYFLNNLIKINNLNNEDIKILYIDNNNSFKNEKLKNKKITHIENIFTFLQLKNLLSLSINNEVKFKFII
jgi:RecA/RadA recombinase